MVFFFLLLRSVKPFEFLIQIVGICLFIFLRDCGIAFVSAKMKFHNFIFSWRLMINFIVSCYLISIWHFQFNHAILLNINLVISISLFFIFLFSVKPIFQTFNVLDPSSNFLLILFPPFCVISTFYVSDFLRYILQSF